MLLVVLSLTQHQLLERGESLFQLAVHQPQLVYFQSQLFDFNRLLLKRLRALVQLLDCGEADTRQILHAD